MKVRFFNIVWDTDGELADLPVDTVIDSKLGNCFTFRLLETK